MSLTEDYLAKAYQLSTDTNTPTEVYTAMKRVTKATLKHLKAIYTVNLLQKLVKKRVPLTTVWNQCNKTCRGLGKEKVTKMCNIVMEWKLQDACKVLKRSEQEKRRIQRETLHIFHENAVGEEHHTIWRQERDRQKEALNNKKKRKISFLTEKYGRKNEFSKTETIEGIRIADHPLTEEFESRPRCYGGVQLKEEEVKALSLGPKFSIYQRNINIEEIETQIEKGMTKLRWSRMSKTETDGEDQKKKKNERDQVEERRTEDTVSREKETKTTTHEERMWPLDIDENRLDFQHLRPTDLPFNKRVHMPPPLEDEEEIKLQKLKADLIDITREYAEENRKKPSRTKSNLTEQEHNGIESLKKRENIMIMQTDKSGRFSVDSEDNYRRSCMPHVEKDQVIDERQYLQAQKEINAHSIIWTRVLKAGMKTKGESRIKQNMVVENHGLAKIYTLRKDHKKNYDETTGPPSRPVCGASAAHNKNLSHLISKILRPVWQEESTVCTSTEEMLATIKEINEQGVREGSTIGSADVKALYPNLDIDFTAQKVGEMFLNSQLEVEVDTKELGLYLSLNMKEEELDKLEIAHFCPKQRTKAGRPPKITGCATSENQENRYKPWVLPKKIPNNREKKLMLSEALKVVIRYIMKNHIYNFEDTIRKQNKGGAIGLELTGDIAQIMMSWWDRELLRRLKEETSMEIIMYKRYVDDINIIVRTDVQEDIDNEKHIEEESNIKKVQEVGNNIHPSIQVEIDYPSLHRDSKLPILDLKVWIEDDGAGNRNIMHEFFQKDMASKTVVNARSAMPWKTKRTIMTQEALRILLHCSNKLPWEVTKEHMNHFVSKMQFSGYDKTFRGQVIKSALNAYHKLQAMEKEGVRPMYRPREWKKTERAKERRRKRTEWFKEGNNETVIFIPATQGSELKRRFNEAISKTDVRMKIVEHTGKTIKSMLQRTNRSKHNGCGDTRCLVCKEDRGGPCRAEGVTYEVKCSKCRDIYVGETGRNGFSRGKEHQNALKRKEKTSPLWRHIQEKHRDETPIPTFSMKITKVFYNDPTLRQITEAVKIKNTPENKLINDRSEWNYNPLSQMKTIVTRI